MIIGLDVGGTHTDVVLLDNKGLVRDIKVLTRQSDLFGTVLEGLDRVTENLDPVNINRVVLSTTLTTNTIVQQKAFPVAMVIAAGPGIDPENYRTDCRFFNVAGAIDHRGREISPIDADELQKIGALIAAEGIRHVGVVGKFSIRNPDHEIAIRDILNSTGTLEKVFLGHQISGNLNFPRRIATTFLHAAVYPVHKLFFGAVKKSLEKKGFVMPIRVLKADGGNTKFETSIDLPAQTILSGPAASVMGAIPHSPKDRESIVMDIGGTTTDMAVLVDGVPLLNSQGAELGGLKTLIRSLDTFSIGIGGDSFVRVNKGKLEIGPERRGPAMAYGGPEPTPTDALVVLGKIEQVDPEKSVQGLTPVAAALGLSVEAAARRIFDQACNHILSSARDMIRRINAKPVYTVHELLEGHQVDPRLILVLGGPAPYFAENLETLSALAVRVVPRWTVANAIGAALARTTCEVNFFADTQLGIASAPEERYSEKINTDFDRKDAVETALDLLRQKAVKTGSNPDHIEMEVVEEMSFNMVRGFHTTGRNIRVKVQVKPGLIEGYGVFRGDDA